MTITDIAYTEIYVEDLEGAADHLSSRVGLEPIAERRSARERSLALRTDGLTLVVTTATAPGPVADFLTEHGDGVADIAFVCTDISDTFARALAAGRLIVRGDGDAPPSAAGFGSVRHTLVPPGGRRRPAGAWHPLALPLGGPATHLSLDHVAVCLPAGTMAGTEAYYKDVFGLTRQSTEYIQVGAQAMDSVVVGDGGAVTFTLLEPDIRFEPGQIDRFLNANHGAGVQHLAFRVDDIVVAVHAMEQRGVEFLKAPDRYYDTLAERLPETAPQIAELREANVLADHDEWGHLLQIFTSPVTPRGTLFYELIQREEARGFGAGNIRALYEAVQRSEQLVGADAGVRS